MSKNCFYDVQGNFSCDSIENFISDKKLNSQCLNKESCLSLNMGLNSKNNFKPSSTMTCSPQQLTPIANACKAGKISDIQCPKPGFGKKTDQNCCNNFVKKNYFQTMCTI